MNTIKDKTQHKLQSPAAVALEVRGACKSFGKDSAVRVLDNVSFSVPAGEVVAIIGPSGCGKSTLLNMMAGLFAPDAGEILIDGTPSVALLGQIGYMQQNDLLLPWRTALENARLGLEIQGVARIKADDVVRSFATQFGLADALTRRPYELSGGMRQRVALLRAMLVAKGVLLLDEPFCALDAITRRKLQSWLMGMLQTNRTTTVLITHDVDEALLLSDRVLVMSDLPSKIVAEVAVDLARPRSVDVFASAKFHQLRTQIELLLKNDRLN